MPLPSVAIVGMAGIFPGSNDINQFWQNIISKYNAVGPIPEERWIIPPNKVLQKAPAPDKAFSLNAGLIRDFKFDASGYHSDGKLLRSLDPMHQIVLHTGKTAIEQITLPPSGTERIGIILAAIALPTDSASRLARKLLSHSHEKAIFEKHFQDTTLNLTRNDCLAAKVTGFPAAIAAQALGLGGGTYTLDAACASSLYALRLACDELQAYRADAMLAGGVSRPDCLFTQIGFSQLHALSPTGRCAPFDAQADGLVVGEGAGMVVLKRTQDALRDGDRIHGIIRGIGISNDIKGNLLAPDNEGQLRAMVAAYDSAGWQPNQIDLIECHGAGTPVGDATELISLKNLWSPHKWSPQQCAIGSVKSMIGHLLTAAGIAGVIKVLLALKHQKLPPSLNFTNAHQDSAIHASPFRVQTEVQAWNRRHPNTTLKAAVSAFGFGGINAHLLIEEWLPPPFDQSNGDAGPPYRIADTLKKDAEPRYHQNVTKPVAVVGMAAVAGHLESLHAIQQAIFRGRSSIKERPSERWQGCDSILRNCGNDSLFDGSFIESLRVMITDFHIPPKEITDLLPQQLLMLKIAAEALQNAKMPLRKIRPKTGAIVGIDFDFETTDYHLRWNMPNAVAEWRLKYGLKIDDMAAAKWTETLQEAYHPPLTASRTMGSLGSIVASRLAREFRLGGPSFAVSCDSASGLKALEIAVRLIQQNELDTALVGAVDLGGDPRQVFAFSQWRPVSQKNQIRPFDQRADGALTGEGAVAIVLKPLSQAIEDEDRIYAIIHGIGSASKGDCATFTPTAAAYTLSLDKALTDAGGRDEFDFDSIGYIETHGSGIPQEDNAEAGALLAKGRENEPDQDLKSCAIGSCKSNFGHMGAAAGLMSFLKASLCLYHEIIPPLLGFTSSYENKWSGSPYYLPQFAEYWACNRELGPRRACVGAMTMDGNCMHLLIEGAPACTTDQHVPMTSPEWEPLRLRPLGDEAVGLFAINAHTQQGLIANLDRLNGKLDQKNTPVSMDALARRWYQHHQFKASLGLCVAIVASSASELKQHIAEAKRLVAADEAQQIKGRGGVGFSPKPVGVGGKMAFVFPGSGNHFIGMGRTLNLVWPEVVREMHCETQNLKTQLRSRFFVPHGSAWDSNWETKAYHAILSNPLHAIFGQVIYGCIVTRLLKRFGIMPGGVIGYSLGESAGLFAMGVWTDREKMLKRMQQNDLFSNQLAGDCLSLRKAWQIAANEPFVWRVAAVNCPKESVTALLSQYLFARLLIVNSYNECVIGGRQDHIEAIISQLKCDAVFLEGVTTVHCDALAPVAAEYKNLHIFPTTPLENVDFYSCAQGKRYNITPESAAESILGQALNGFDFTRTIRTAYQDGVRVFLEIGPHASCTRMIQNILDGEPHLALSVSSRNENEYLSMLKALGTLVVEGLPVNLDALYGDQSMAVKQTQKLPSVTHDPLITQIGRRVSLPKPPAQPLTTGINSDDSDRLEPQMNNTVMASEMSPSDPQNLKIMEVFNQTIQATAEAHQDYLKFAEDLTHAYGQSFQLQAQLLEQLIAENQAQESSEGFRQKDIKIPSPYPKSDIGSATDLAFSRKVCMEFAIGSVATVLGPEFAQVDTYPVRVRLPDEPLMLVDRILAVEGEKNSLKAGRIVTEHDVLSDKWYLDGGRAPVCISVEAGQADLFLCAYLGIDLAVKGKRKYRLLDATVTFHRGLPRPGDTIRYDIQIEKFIRQGETYLFLFHFDGFIGDERLISMRNGCAGFFTEEEICGSGGILDTPADEYKEVSKKQRPWTPIVPTSIESYNDTQLAALRKGDLQFCFGDEFMGISIQPNLRLPGKRMKLIDRIIELDPHGGVAGLGFIRAEADIHPDDWFLTCHFVDDMVMPGTLMYECCAHTLRVFLQRNGWVTNKPGARYEPVIGIHSVLKCRGPVTPSTRKVHYDIDIKEIGYNPEPYVIADASMYADGHFIVHFTDMGMRLADVTRAELSSFWMQTDKPTHSLPVSPQPKPLFDKRHILEFALGKPSEAFGEAYRPFDSHRFIARLPAPPYSFIDRIVRCEPEPWVLKADGWAEAEYEVCPDAWYFKANRTAHMPFCVLQEIALQACGWLAAYMGSALRSSKDLRFRNLGGMAVLHQNVAAISIALNIRTRLKSVSEAGDMIIENFEFQIRHNHQLVYSGDTNFGFFTSEALAQQIGIRNAEQSAELLIRGLDDSKTLYALQKEAPLFPDDTNATSHEKMALPSAALLMVDCIEAFDANGGPKGLGSIRGVKRVNPEEWFFQAHFFQDPVCPGSLGLESLLQLLKYIALKRWPQFRTTHHFSLLTETEHQWQYRGQIIPQNEIIEIEAAVSHISDHPMPTIKADGFLKVDGRYIYAMKDFGIQVMPD